MTVSTISASASAAAAPLVKLANGEYTAASVAADPAAASKLGLVKEKDGNYGAATASAAAGGTGTAQSSSGVLAALASLTLGGQ